MAYEQRQTLREKLARGIAYTAPILAIVAGGATMHAIGSDLLTEQGYSMTAVGEAEAEGMPEAEGAAEAMPEAMPEAEAEAEAEAMPEAEAEAEAMPEAEAEAESR
jgi:hypothetical protein